MHILTKIFAVLVSLLAVLLVPLVVVYTHNEDSYRARFERTTAQKDAATASLAEAEARFGAEQNRMQALIDELTRSKTDLAKDAVEAEGEIRRLESRLAAEQSMKAEIDSKLTTLATTMRSGQDLTQSLVEEVRSLRSDSLALERQKVELDEALRDVTGQLEVAVQARRALQEELQRIKDELASAHSSISNAVAQGFNPQQEVRGGFIGADTGVAPTVNLDSTVISVRRSSDQTLAEIDVGSLDGVKIGWVLTIARGGAFKGKLRVINVDVNRSTGVVSLEDSFQGRSVEIGDTAYARIGQD